MSRLRVLPLMYHYFDMFSIAFCIPRLYLGRTIARTFLMDVV